MVNLSLAGSRVGTDEDDESTRLVTVLGEVRADFQGGGSLC